MIRSAPARRRWDTKWPLPIGKKSVIRNKPYLADRPGLPGGIEDLIEVLNVVPFDEYESALWALRIVRNDSTLDLFGLCNYLMDLKEGEISEGYIVCQHESEQFGSRVLEVEKGKDGAATAIVSTVDGDIQRIPANLLKLHYSYAPTGNGKLAFSLKGQDTSLLDLAYAAKRWWSAFEGTPIGGRPPNSGTWRSNDEFKEALNNAMSELRARGRKLTQESVSSFFSEAPGLPNCTDRQLRRWLTEHRLTWPEAKEL